MPQTQTTIKKTLKALRKVKDALRKIPVKCLFVFYIYLGDAQFTFYDDAVEGLEHMDYQRQLDIVQQRHDEKQEQDRLERYRHRSISQETKMIKELAKNSKKRKAEKKKPSPMDITLSIRGGNGV